MVKPIDRFVSALHRDNADEIVLETGKPGRMRIRTQEKIILAQDVRHEQIEVLLRDIVPQEAQPRLVVDGEITFPYQSPTGSVMVRFSRNQGSVLVNIWPHQTQTAPPEQAPARPQQHQRPAGNTPTYAPHGAAPQSRDSRAQSGAHPAPHSGRNSPARASSSVSGTDALRHTAAPMHSPPVNPGRGGWANAAPQNPDDWAISLDLGPPSPTGPEATEALNAPRAVARMDANLSAMLEAMSRAGCSDLHLTTGLPPRARRGGDLLTLPGFEYAVDAPTIESWLLTIAPPVVRKRFEQTNDAYFACTLAGVARFRINVSRDRRGPYGVIRAIPDAPPTVEVLGLPQAVSEIAMLERGLVIVSGGKGAGKSTTLAAIVELMNRARTIHLVTIEDPIEFTYQERYTMIHQRQVQVDTDTFETGLRAAIRQDPDAILLGEMQTEEATLLALEAASSGILVLTTMHADTAVGSIDRLILQFPIDRQPSIRTMLSWTLKCIIAQILCRHAGGGRVAALEILPNSPQIATLIREGKTSQIPSVMATGQAAGMQPLNDALARLVVHGLITTEEAMARSPATSQLLTLIERGPGEGW